MNKQKKILAVSAVFIGLSIALLFGVISIGNQSSGLVSAKKGLAGADIQEISSYAMKYISSDAQYKVEGTPQLLLTRMVTRQELPRLGLGCMSSVTIEEPPLALVVFKGNFMVQGSMSPKMAASYVAYIFDLWAAAPNSTIWSTNGSVFRTILNDASLPNDNSAMPVVCPTDIPDKTLHYGDTLLPYLAIPNNPFSNNTAAGTLAPSSTQDK